MLSAMLSRRVLPFLATGIGFVVWLATMRCQPGIVVLAHYLGLIGAISGVATVLTSRWPRRWEVRVLICSLAVIFGGWIWGRNDWYVDEWVADDGVEVSDRTLRFSRQVFHRHVSVRKDEGFLPAFSGSGPMVRSGVRHGHWSFTEWTTFVTLDKWYWYGEEISEGEWHLRNR